MNFIRLGSFLAALCLPQAAQAVTVSMPGSGCVPDPAQILAQRIEVGNASVRHAGTHINPIVLTCTILPFRTGGGTDWTLRITYRDSTGTSSSGVVRARLYRMPIGTADPILLATVNSNANATMGTTLLESPPFSHTFNFNTNTYWVHVDLDRSASDQAVILHAISLGPPFSSDIRLKHNIALLGRLDNGLGFYRFSYHGSDAAYVGVMAQEVEAIMPEAIVRGSDGYLRVYYGRLGLRMQSWEDWVASGKRIPATARHAGTGTLQ
jgi:Chaperone of endosialidase